jgi:hypothetical protein
MPGERGQDDNTVHLKGGIPTLRTCRFWTLSPDELSPSGRLAQSAQARPAGSAQFHGTAYHGINRHRLALESELPREDFGLTSPPSRQDTFRERRFTEVVCWPQIAPDVHPRTWLHPGSRRVNNGMSIRAVGVAASTALIPPLPHTVFVGLDDFLLSLIGRQSTVAQSIGRQFCELGVARANPVRGSILPASQRFSHSRIDCSRRDRNASSNRQPPKTGASAGSGTAPMFSVDVYRATVA